MEATKCYYATALCFVRGEGGCILDPTQHRYFVFTNFTEEHIKLVNEESLRGIWRLKNGKKERFSFDRISVSNGRELSDLSHYCGQTYKRTPLRKTFIITEEEFLENLQFACKSRKQFA